MGKRPTGYVAMRQKSFPVTKRQTCLPAKLIHGQTTKRSNGHVAIQLNNYVQQLAMRLNNEAVKIVSEKRLKTNYLAAMQSIGQASIRQSSQMVIWPGGQE